LIIQKTISLGFSWKEGVITYLERLVRHDCFGMGKSGNTKIGNPVTTRKEKLTGNME
jgi:hypothetical protein